MRLLIILALLASSSANAKDWVVIHDAPDFLLSMDSEEISQDGNLRKGWIMWEYAEPRLMPRASPQDPERYFVRVWELTSFNCQERKAATVEVIHWAKHSRILNRAERDATGNYTEVVPESLGAFILESVCGWSLDSKPRT